MRIFFKLNYFIVTKNSKKNNYGNVLVLVAVDLNRTKPNRAEPKKTMYCTEIESSQAMLYI